MSLENIIGREREIGLLRDSYESKFSQLVVVYGRRRVGKSFLVNQFFNDDFAFKLVGDYMLDKKRQLRNFHEELKRKSGTGFPVPETWSEAFWQLRDYIDSLEKDKRHVVFFDEMPWLDNHKSGFLQAFEYFWNSYGAAKDNLMFIVCGSATSWLVDHIDHNRGGLFNRTNLRLYLESFTLHETKLFLENRNIHWSYYDICECYMILGGIPYYLNLLDGALPYSANIDNLFFRRHSLLWDEFDHLYNTLFTKSGNYIKVIEALFTRRIGLCRKQIVGISGLSDNAVLTKILKNLVDSGFVRIVQYYGKKKMGTFYQVSDYFTMFYLRFVRNHDVNDEDYWSHSTQSPSRRAWAEFTFEQLCLDHIKQIKKKIGISGVRTKQSSWAVAATDEHPGAQIDLLIDRNDRMISICEMKFSEKPFAIDKDYDLELRRKIGTFSDITKTNKALQLVMVTPYGLVRNMYSNAIQVQVTAEDLFEVCT